MAVTSMLACEAKLETSCVGENCSQYEPKAGEEAIADCLDTCDITAVSDQTGEYPCEIQPLIARCTGCHVDGGIGPFPLVTYEDSQQLRGNQTRYAAMVQQISGEFMPQGGPFFTEAEQQTFLNDWACICAPPKATDETCN